MSNTLLSPSIAVVLYPGCALIDLAALLDVLPPMTGGHRVTTVAARMRPLSGTSGLRLMAERTYDELPRPSALIIPGGGAPTVAALADREMMTYVRNAGASALVVASIGCGSLVLAASGLVDGRSVTTAPDYAGVLAALGGLYADCPITEDGPVVTVADISSLNLLAQAIGARLAQTPAVPSPTGDAS